MIPVLQPQTRAWLIVVLLLPVVFSNFLVRLLPTTMHGSLVAAIPMTEAQFGLLTSTIFWAYGLMSPFGGFLADRLGRTRVIITSMFLWSGLTWLTSYAKTIDQILVLRTLLGLAEACYIPAGLALIADYHKIQTRSMASGIHQSASALGIGLSGLGGWLATHYSWHFAFGIVGLSGVAYAIFLLFVLRDLPRETAGEATPEARPRIRFGEAMGSLLGSGAFILFLVFGGLIGLTVWTVFSWGPVFLQEGFKLTQGFAGLSATGYMQVAAVPGLLLGGYWADKWGRANRRGRMFVPAIGLLIAAPGVLLAANTGILGVAIVGLVIYRFGEAFVATNMMPVICEIADSRYRATAYGLFNFVGMLSAGVGIYCSGVLRDMKINLHVVFDLVAVLTVAAALLMFLLKPKRT